MHAEDWGDGPDLSCCLNLYCAMHLTAAKRGPRVNGTTCGSHGTWCLGVWLTAHSGWSLVTALPMAWLIQHGVCVHGSHIVVPLTVCHTVPRRYVMHDACHMCVSGVCHVITCGSHTTQCSVAWRVPWWRTRHVRVTAGGWCVAHTASGMVFWQFQDNPLSSRISNQRSQLSGDVSWLSGRGPWLFIHVNLIYFPSWCCAVIIHSRDELPISHVRQCLLWTFVQVTQAPAVTGAGGCTPSHHHVRSPYFFPTGS